MLVYRQEGCSRELRLSPGFPTRRNRSAHEQQEHQRCEQPHSVGPNERECQNDHRDHQAKGVSRGSGRTHSSRHELEHIVDRAESANGRTGRKTMPVDEERHHRRPRLRSQPTSREPEREAEKCDRGCGHEIAAGDVPNLSRGEDPDLERQPRQIRDGDRHKRPKGRTARACATSTANKRQPQGRHDAREKNHPRRVIGDVTCDLSER